MPAPGLVGAVLHDVVVHRQRQIGHGDLTIAEVPDAAAIDGIQIHALVAVDDDVTQVLELHPVRADGAF